MLEMGATTTWESVEALERNQGCCFAFSAHPLNYMIRNYLGIIPMEPGYKRFSFRLKPDDLHYAKGKVATPHGYIEVNWHRMNNHLEASLTVPPGCEAVVSLPCISHWRDQSIVMEIDGQKAQLTSQKIAICTFLKDESPAAAIPQGFHKITIRTEQK
jgi:hypothetical protein